ncbi:MAG: SH3 domain-containing protein [Anaerolineae bacterium]|jgi:hypothetical protein|nr:SH3 domain-containing protein [Anaerolineae bacterium]
MATVRTTVDGIRIREAPINGKPIGLVFIRDVLVSLESIESTRRKLGKDGEWLHIRTPNGVEAYVAAQFLEAVDLPEDPNLPKLYVRPTSDGVRLREQPSDGKPVGQVYMRDTLEVLEPTDNAITKLGIQNQWIKLKTPFGLEAYAAAWMLTKTDPPPPIVRIKAGNIVGMNLDQFHPLGTPTPERLSGLGWVRFGYNVSMGKGSQDLQAAYNLYRPLAERYARAGLKVMFVLTHQTYGEGRDEFWPWATMTDASWRTLTGRFTDMVGQIIKQYAGQDLVHAWQVWNEQDAPIGAAASVPMTPSNYSYLLGQTVQCIRSIDPQTAVISGGHTRGPQAGSKYARETINVMPTVELPDGIAFHPYGRGTTPGDRYSNWGHIDEEVNAYMGILPDRPVWITEWGVLDKENDAPADIARYATNFMTHLRDKYPGRIAAAIWYAWAIGMHNGFGLVGRDDRPLEPLYGNFLSLRA